ncbi:MAG: TRAP transporter small permease subunit [Bacteroidota bacterium]|nr:TRAP transporter small permease subunit [Bacteroidota bacterium]|tara:strand:- start:11101 stop:11586 length:486 start_codon:yes stop_codon:yes gene_type:complete
MVLKKIISKTGKISSWFSLALVLLISTDVLLRYVFNFSTAALYEMEWHLFAIIFLLASPYTLQKNKHVRVDVFYNNFSKRKKNIIDLIGNIIFLIPFSFIIFYTSLPFVADSYSILESSPDPGGLPYRFIIKSIIPIAFFLLMIQGILNAIKNYNNIKIKK